jgi:hypothetical protein
MEAIAAAVVVVAVMPAQRIVVKAETQTAPVAHVAAPTTAALIAQVAVERVATAMPMADAAVVAGAVQPQPTQMAKHAAVVATNQLLAPNQHLAHPIAAAVKAVAHVLLIAEAAVLQVVEVPVLQAAEARLQVAVQLRAAEVLLQVVEVLLRAAADAAHVAITNFDPTDLI